VDVAHPLMKSRLRVDFKSVFAANGKGIGVNSLAEPQNDERQERFLRLFLLEQGGIRAFIRATVWNRALCDDLFQEVAMVLWRELDRYDPERPFGAWARGVTAKTVLKSYRQGKRTTGALTSDAVVALEAAFEQLSLTEEVTLSLSSREEALRNCLDQLPDRSRALVRLRYSESLKAGEIAVRLASSPDAVQKALSRVRDALRKCVDRRLRAA
jgi:RNA polymerase sigma-70 factor (ECF subfamily)